MMLHLLQNVASITCGFALGAVSIELHSPLLTAGALVVIALCVTSLDMLTIEPRDRLLIEPERMRIIQHAQKTPTKERQSSEQLSRVDHTSTDN